MCGIARRIASPLPHPASVNVVAPFSSAIAPVPSVERPTTTTISLAKRRVRSITSAMLPASCFAGITTDTSAAT